MVLHFTYLSSSYLLKHNLVLCLIRSDLSKDFFHDPGIETANVKSGPVVGGKPPLCPKSKDSAKVTATHSEPHLPTALDDANHHREPQTFPIHKPLFDSKVFAASIFSFRSLLLLLYYQITSFYVQ